jgi:hypothetical protein
MSTSVSRAFVKEDDGERGNLVSDILHREAKIEWLKIQEKKLDKRNQGRY